MKGTKFHHSYPIPYQGFLRKKKAACTTQVPIVCGGIAKWKYILHTMIMMMTVMMMMHHGHLCFTSMIKCTVSLYSKPSRLESNRYRKKFLPNPELQNKWLTPEKKTNW